MESIKKIEEALGITIEEDNYGTKQEHTYSLVGGKRVYSLRLKNITFENFDVLSELYQELFNLELIECTLLDVSAFFNFKRLSDLKLDNCVLNTEKIIEPKLVNAIDFQFNTIRLKNMEIEQLSFFLPMLKNTTYLYLTKCELSNYYEINLLPKLYHLVLTDVTIHQKETDVVHQADSKRKFYFMDLKEMNLSDFELLLPFSENIEFLEIENCTIGSFRTLDKFPKLNSLTIDPATKVKDSEPVKDGAGDLFVLNECIISENETSDNEFIKETVFDLKKLVSIAHWITDMKLINYQLVNSESLKHFTKLETLRFEKGEMNLKHFLPVSDQIKTICLDECTFKNPKLLERFKQLESLEIQDGYEEGNEKKVLKNFKKLLPLKHQLKKLRLWEDGVKEINQLEEFTALESIDIYDVSERNAECIFSLPNLKRLSVNIIAKKPCSFNLKGIPKIEWLVVKSENEVNLEGLKHLDNLERLELENDDCVVNLIHDAQNLKHFKCNSTTDINKVETIKTLQTLEFDVHEDYEINGLQQFPNLKYLSVPNTNKITLGKLDQLKVINMEGGSPDNIDFLKELPNLEKLDLGCKGLKDIPDLRTLTNLKMLNLAENSFIENIEGLENLKSLEYLNLYDNNISNISVLNTLPNLKQVNLAGNPIDKKEIEQQLDHPEIAVFMGISRSPFRVWENDEFYEH